MKSLPGILFSAAGVALAVVSLGCLEGMEPTPLLEDGAASLRVVAAADVAPLDVWLDEERVESGLSPGTVSPSPADGTLSVRAGTHVVSFPLFGAPLEDALYARMFRLVAGSRYTLYTFGSLASGPGAPFGATVVGNNRPCADGVSCWRVVHTAPGISALDVFVYAKAGEGWVRITDEPLREGEAMREPVESDASVTCYLGVGPPGSDAPTLAFEYVAPTGDMLLFLRSEAMVFAGLPGMAIAADDVTWAPPPITAVGDSLPREAARTLDALPRAQPTLLIVGDGWASEIGAIGEQPHEPPIMVW